MASGQNMNINQFFHAADYITIYYYKLGNLMIEPISHDRIWKFVVQKGLHIADEASGEKWTKEEFFNECKPIIEGILRQQWQNLV